MIEKVSGFKVGDQFFPTIQEAQASELESLIRTFYQSADKVLSPADISAQIIENTEKVIDILSMTARSIPKARKINGGTKRRKKVSPESVEAAECAVAKEPTML